MEQLCKWNSKLEISSSKTTDDIDKKVHCGSQTGSMVISFKASKRSPFLLRGILLFFVTVIGVYICYVCLKQVTVQINPNKSNSTFRNSKTHCNMSSVSPTDALYVHFPQPKTYRRGECACTLVRVFVILSMQRSGSGWFETLLNSHPNISSNGEIFSVKERRTNISTILKTLDMVYSLDWLSSAAKNECVAAFGFKWMLNQAVLDYHSEIANYFNWKGVSVIFLFRRNLLRRLISLLANAYDRHAKLLNGTHKSHVHSKEEVEVLAQFKPVINVATLVPKLTHAERMMADSLLYFNTTRNIIMYYEDILGNKQTLSNVQEFLGVPVRKLKSRQLKIHTRPPLEQVVNWQDVYQTLNGTPYEHFLQRTDYI